MQSVPFEMPIDYVANGDGTGRPVYAESNSRLRVKFVRKYVPNPQKSLEAGREVLDEQILLVKSVIGDTNIPASRVTEADKQTYRAEWEAFQRQEQGPAGQPITSLYGLTQQQVAYLQRYNIRAIGELVGASESLIAAVPDGEKAQALAKIWLEAREAESSGSSLILEVDHYKKRVEELEVENEQLKAAKPKRGRPKRVKEQDVTNKS